MNTPKPIRLKPGKEHSILARHMWIFSGAVQNPQDVVDGHVHTVLSSDLKPLGIAYFNSRCSIIGRMLSYTVESPEVALRRHLKNSIEMRKQVLKPSSSEMYRLVHAEADFLPGLIVDVYGDGVVLQFATLGMSQFRNVIVDILKESLPLTWIYERSTSSSRKIEGLEPCEKTLWGTEKQDLVATENDLHYAIDCKKGQKTGFFLDQREMRSLVRSYAKDRRVLNCFSYSGGFSLSALKGGAKQCVSLDVSAPALQLLEKNLSLNGLFGDPRHSSECGDVFCFLRDQETLPYDLVILDPPAFAKRPEEVKNALKGYREINCQVLKKIPSNSLLLTCSCSHFVTHELFLKMLKMASLQVNRPIQLLTNHHNSPDHPLSLYHPESDYLKTYLLYVP